MFPRYRRAYKNLGQIHAKNTVSDSKLYMIVTSKMYTSDNFKTRMLLFDK